MLSESPLQPNRVVEMPKFFLSAILVLVEVLPDPRISVRFHHSTRKTRRHETLHHNTDLGRSIDLKFLGQYLLEQANGSERLELVIFPDERYGKRRGTFG
jgi:hypothetical protein